MNMSICDNIKKRFIRLSKGQRKVAQFVVDNPNVIASQVASEVGRLAGVSESTVIRFCYAIDLSGFSELQEKMKEFVIESGGIPSPKRKAAKKEKKNACNLVMANDIDEISQTLQAIDENDFDRAVQFIHQAKQVHILGFRQSAPAAQWLFNNLQLLREQLFMMEFNAEKIAEQLSKMDEYSVLFVVALTKDSEDIIRVMDIAKKKNVKIIVMHCPSTQEAVSKYADVALKVDVEKIESVTCSIASFSLLHAIVECIVQQNKLHYGEQRQTQVEALRLANQLTQLTATY